MIKKCLNTENTIDDGMFFLNKEFCANGISLLTYSHPRVLDLLIFMAFPRPTKPISVWGLFYRQLERIITTWLNGWKKDWNHSMELPVDNKISFIGIEIIRNRTKIDTQVYRKPTNTGLLLHFQSPTDKRYKDCLLKTTDSSCICSSKIHRSSIVNDKLGWRL